MPYQSTHGDTIARMILARGQALAEASRASSDAWAGAVSGIGQQVGGTLRDLASYEEAAPRRKLEAAQVKHSLADLTRSDDVTAAVKSVPLRPDGTPDFRTVAGKVQAIDPKAALDWWSKASDEDKLQLANDRERANEVAQTAGSILSADPQHRPELYALARNEFIKRGHYTDAQIPTEYDENWLKMKFGEAATVSQQIDHAEKLVDQEIARTKANAPRDQNFSTQTLTDAKGNAFQASFESNSNKWFRGDKDITSDVANGVYTKSDKSTTPADGSPEAMFRATAAELYPGRPISTLNGSEQTAVKKKVNDRISSGTGSLVAVTETDPDTGEETVRLVPKVEGRVIKHTNPDDATLPKGVKDYIYTLARKPGPDGKTPLTFEQAQSDLAATWPSLTKDHPRLDPVKADGALRELFRPAPGSGAQSFMDLAAALSGKGTPGAAAPAAPALAPRPAQPTQPPVPAPAPAPASPPAPTAPASDFTVSVNNDKSVTVVAPDGTRVRFKSKADADAAVAKYKEQIASSSR